jgi:hypothetical protein
VDKEPDNQQAPEMDDDDLERYFSLDDEAGLPLVSQCMYCHSIRNEAGEWVRLEDSADSSGPFSHSTCPQCEPKLFAQLGVGNLNESD